MTTYVLINTRVEARKAVTRWAARLPGVVSAEPVSGAYDVIVRAASPAGAEGAGALLSIIRSIPGVVRALACPVASAAPAPALPRAG